MCCFDNSVWSAFCQKADQFEAIVAEPVAAPFGFHASSQPRYHCLDQVACGDACIRSGSSDDAVLVLTGWRDSVFVQTEWRDSVFVLTGWRDDRVTCVCCRQGITPTVTVPSGQPMLASSDVSQQSTPLTPTSIPEIILSGEYNCPSVTCPSRALHSHRPAYPRSYCLVSKTVLQ